jgi:hypothetical protein
MYYAKKDPHHPFSANGSVMRQQTTNFGRRRALKGGEQGEGGCWWRWGPHHTGMSSWAPSGSILRCINFHVDHTRLPQAKKHRTIRSVCTYSIALQSRPPTHGFLLAVNPEPGPVATPTGLQPCHATAQNLLQWSTRSICGPSHPLYNTSSTGTNQQH